MFIQRDARGVADIHRRRVGQAVPDPKRGVGLRQLQGVPGSQQRGHPQLRAPQASEEKPVEE